MMPAFFIALIFSPFAAAIAFAITYAEYAKHLIDKKRVLKKALGTALVAFVFFLIVPTFLIWLFLVL
jgi:hypothetical protein